SRVIGNSILERQAMTTNVVYVVKDGGSDRYCKIGKDTIWPFRFHQAQSHTPRGIDLVGAWTFRRDELDQMEREAHAGLPRRREAEGDEWFAVATTEVLQLLERRFGRRPDITTPPPPRRNGPYDDWRSLSDHPKGKPDHVFKRRLWIMREEGPDLRVKV